MTDIQWTDAEREAVHDALAYTTIGTGYYSTTVDIDATCEMTEAALTALAPLIAARERAAGARALREAADNIYDHSGAGQWFKPSAAVYLRNRAAALEDESVNYE